MIRIFLLALLVSISQASNATAIFTTELGVISATMGSAYPSLPGSPVYTEYALSAVLHSGFSSEEYSSAPYPNLGWVSWDLSEQRLGFQAGQEVCIDCGFDHQGFGFSNLDFLWVFSVEGNGGAIQQDLFSGTGTVQSTLIDLTDPTTFVSLSVASGFQHSGERTTLQNDHTYLMYANLSNQSTGDGFEAEYFISLEDAKIEVAEPSPLLLFLFGLIILGFVQKSRSGLQTPTAYFEAH